MNSDTTKARILPIHPAGAFLAVTMIAATLAVLVARDCHLNQLYHNIHPSYTPSLLYGGVYWMWWVGVALVLWKVVDRRPGAFRPSGRVLVAHTVTSCLLGAAHLLLLQYATIFASWYWPVWGIHMAHFSVESLERLGVEVVLYGFIGLVCAFLHSRMETQEALIQKMEVERQLTQAQLKALQMQMEPHFLFNTMNAITSLMVQGRNTEAIRTMTHLSDILRATLQRNAPGKIPFSEELRIVESYLAIQQVRFAGRLAVKIDATEEAKDGLVPCFLLQPLVENAIQHGIAPRRQGGSVETCVKRVGEMLWVQVKDDGCGDDGTSEKGHGIGLQNIRERLAHFYPGSHEFRTLSPSTGGYEVTIKIPYERAVA